MPESRYFYLFSGFFYYKHSSAHLSIICLILGSSPGGLDKIGLKRVLSSQFENRDWMCRSFIIGGIKVFTPVMRVRIW